MSSIFFDQYLPSIKNDLIKKVDAAYLSYTFDFFPLEEILNFLSAENIFYFYSKEDDVEFLGLGIANTISNQNNSLENQFYSFSMNFEDTRKDLYLTLHEWTFVSKDKKVSLTINKLNNSFSPIGLFFHPLDFSNNFPRWQSYDETPDQHEWKEMIQKAKLAFEKQEIDKIILHRKKIFDFIEPIDPILLFDRLLKHNKNSNFKIYHQKNFDRAFISFSPEKLFSIENNSLITYAIAGSMPKGLTEQEELENEHFLQTNYKLNKEHQIVVDEIKHQLNSISNNTQISELNILKLAYIMHRSIKFKVTLKENVNFMDIIALLHPTPAIGGYPTKAAIQKIKEIEGDQRKEYAAPIGIYSKELSSVAVGIRSALLDSTKLSIYGGCGIIMESDPEEEWIETGIKMKPFTSAINYE